MTAATVTTQPEAERLVAARITGLRKNFGARTVLDGIDLEIGAGEIVALVNVPIDLPRPRAAASGEVAGYATRLLALLGVTH